MVCMCVCVSTDVFPDSERKAADVGHGCQRFSSPGQAREGQSVSGTTCLLLFPVSHRESVF